MASNLLLAPWQQAGNLFPVGGLVIVSDEVQNGRATCKPEGLVSHSPPFLLKISF